MQEAKSRREIERGRLLYQLYPDEGPLRRELYDKHLEFFAAGALHNERVFLGGNRTGKTFCGGYEATCHLTGWYPDWWQGRRFDRQVIGWASGEDEKAVRESLQPKLLGPITDIGTGLIPRELISRAPRRTGTTDAIDFVSVRHISGNLSRLVFKNYKQGAETFESTEIDFALLDEEPPLSIYTATLTRTMSTKPGKANGLVMCAFTPLKGVSDTVLQFLPGGAYPATEELRKSAWGW